MPSAARNQSRASLEPSLDDFASDVQGYADEPSADPAFQDEEMLEEEEEEEEVGEGEESIAPDGMPVSTTPPAPPPGLKEISSLANWTVSSSKPGCGVAALRSPTTSLFWQSDGPQPHHLNIHFFKMVAIAGIRIYLDFHVDESYTPTLIRFAAGTGYNDLQEFSSMRFEQPRGWIDVAWDGVGEPGCDDEDDPESSPPLRCMLIQVRICENHQNGKDTHLRGLQLFAKDGTAKPPAVDRAVTSQAVTLPDRPLKQAAEKRRNRLDLSGWLEQPVLR